MEEKLFAELVESVKEAGAYLRGESDPSRIYVIQPEVVASSNGAERPRDVGRNDDAPAD